MSHIKEYVDKLTRVYERYTEYVRTNPAATAQLESTVRTLSYLIAGESRQHLFKLVSMAQSKAQVAAEAVLRLSISCASLQLRDNTFSFHS